MEWKSTPVKMPSRKFTSPSAPNGNRKCGTNDLFSREVLLQAGIEPIEEKKVASIVLYDKEKIQ